VTAIGEVPTGGAITRAGARVGDVVYVSGTLGDAALALAIRAGRAHAEAHEVRALERRLDRPEPRVALGIALRGIASSALDVSDGLTGDLGHILEASHVGAVIDLAAVPCCGPLRSLLGGRERALVLAALLAGGDDYELCFTASAAMREPIARLSRELALPLTPIGEITRAPGLVVRDAHGEPIAPLPRAFDHFG
jgi:thiamine-monophosphate kinase